MLMTQTVDGKVARHQDEFTNWSSREDKKLFVTETRRAGVLIIGRRTWETIGRPLPGRKIIVLTQKPIENKKIETDQGTVEFTQAEPKKILADLETQGYLEAIVASPTINGLFLTAGLIDEIKLTIEPKLFGQGLGLIEGLKTDTDLNLIESKNLSPQVIFLHYKIVKN